jgi:hypothetical protein
MLRVLGSKSLSYAKCVKPIPVANIAVRNFSEKTIKSDVEHQAGRRKEEMDAESSGDVGFNRDPIVPPVDAGTRENPIKVRTHSFEIISC